MKTKELMLAALAPARQAPHQPVQIQKLFFLIDENIPEHVDGPHFGFEPCAYGPYDKAVYQELNKLADEDYVEICPERSWRTYRLTVKGQADGEKLLGNLAPAVRNYMESLSEFVHSLSFTQLVSSIYRAYPHMRENSVFRNVRGLVLTDAQPNTPSQGGG